jgi:DNA-binding NtrC family response regulator
MEKTKKQVSARVTAGLAHASTKELDDKILSGTAAANERMHRVEEGLSDLLRRLTDVEDVVSDLIERRSDLTSLTTTTCTRS